MREAICFETFFRGYDKFEIVSQITAWYLTIYLEHTKQIKNIGKRVGINERSSVSNNLFLISVLSLDRELHHST